MHHLGMHGSDAVFALAAVLVGVAFAGDWVGTMISLALKRWRPKRGPHRQARSGQLVNRDDRGEDREVLRIRKLD
jgi:hypothetical protein